jgi:hypothetical protein
MQQYIDSVTAPESSVVYDDFSILLNRSDQSMALLTTLEAIAKSREENQSITWSGAAPQQRMIQFGVAMHHDGRLCSMSTIWDRKFVKQQETPLVCDMGDHLFVILHHPKCPGIKVETAKLCTVCLPQLVAYREHLIAQHIAGIQTVHLDFCPTVSNDQENIDTSNSAAFTSHCQICSRI